MSYTVGQAAKAAGKSKSTISRAIESGRISAERREDGSYIIQPVELHRVFPPASTATVQDRTGDALRDSGATGVAEVELRVLQERLEGVQRELRLRDDQVRDLNSRLDEAHEEKMRLTALLTAREPMPAADPGPDPAPVARRGFWRWGRTV